MTWSPALLAEPLQTKGDPYEIGLYTDEWGCTFENRQHQMRDVWDPQITAELAWERRLHLAGNMYILLEFEATATR